MIILFISAPLVLLMGTTLGWYLYKNDGGDDSFNFFMPFILSLLVAFGLTLGGNAVRNDNLKDKRYLNHMTSTYKIHVVDYSKTYNWIKFQKDGKDCEANLDALDSNTILTRTVDCSYTSLSLDDAVKAQ